MATYKALETNGLNFKDLCDIGDGYRNEVGTSGERRGALGNLGTKLARAVAAAKGFQMAGRSPQSTDAKGVKNLAAFHTSQQTHVKDAEQSRLNQVVIRLRTWLSRQGAWFVGDGDINWDITMKATVAYDSQLEQQEMSKIKFIGGLLFMPDGTPADTAKMVTHFSGPGFAIYVMSAEGNLHIGSHSVGQRHHSSLLAGASVAGAGEIVISGGKVTYLSNKSGHYRPQRCHLLNVLGMLQHHGVNLDFKLCVQPGNETYSTVDEFMVKNNLDDASIDQATEDLEVVYALDLSTDSSYPGKGTYANYQPSAPTVYANYTPASGPAPVYYKSSPAIQIVYIS